MSEKVHNMLLITPGEHIKDILHDNNINVYDFCIKYPKVIGVVNEYMELDEEIAAMLEEGTKIKASFWLNLQRIYNEKKAAANEYSNG